METLVEIADQSPPKRPRYDKEDEELLEKVNSEEVTEMTFRDCLTQHVEQVRKNLYRNKIKINLSLGHIFLCALFQDVSALLFRSHI